jgi:hypothetical protein
MAKLADEFLPKPQIAPLFQAPLFRLDGILGRVVAQILCTRLIDAEPSLRGSEGKALK